MQAMEDAMTLAELIPAWLKAGDVSAKVLSAFERARRPQVNMLQRLADEQVIFWNTGNPLLGLSARSSLPDLRSNRRLRYQVLTTTAGFRATAPFGLREHKYKKINLKKKDKKQLHKETNNAKNDFSKK
jgi:2-polyprenyl-6-methoxyphenol hydroxylase-like FAD-dependent oxidoreductase